MINLKIQDSICTGCKHFWHECGVEELDYGCAEYCYHSDNVIKDRFYDEFEIKECDGFDED